MSSYLSEVPNPGFPAVSELDPFDYVQGGPEGNDNRPHAQLAERTAYVKRGVEQVAADVAVLRARLDAINLESGTSLRNAVLLSWLYKDDSPSFELFAPAFSWRDLDPIAVTGSVAGDDSLDLVTTAGLKEGATYVLMDASNRLLEVLDVQSVLSGTRLRSRLNLAHTLGPADGAFLARTSFDIRDGYAVLQGGDRLYSRILTELRNQPGGQVVIRRQASDDGVLEVAYRTPTTTPNAPYTVAKLASVSAQAAARRDEIYTLAFGGPLEFRLTYANPDAAKRAQIDHIVMLPPARPDGLPLVAQPTVTAPVVDARNVGATPTIVLSPYYSLYGVPQGGAFFQIAADEDGDNILFDTDADLLAAWNAVSGQSASFADVVALAPRDFLAIGNAVSQRFQIAPDGTVTPTAGTVTGDLKRVHGSAALVAAVGAAGALRTSTDAGATYTARTAAASYSGTFNGVFVNNAVVVAAGTAAMVQRSTNAGAIFSVVTPDGGYGGDFQDMAGDGLGNLILVGTGGEVQTSADGGQTLIRRALPGNYAGTLRAVALGPDGFAVAVGDNGAIFKSTDRGYTWTLKAAANGFAGTFYGVALKGASVVVVGTSAAIQTSTNQAESFKARTAGGGATATLRTVALDPNLYGFALGDTGTVQRTLRLDGAVDRVTVPAGVVATDGVYHAFGGYIDQNGVRSARSPGRAFATASLFAGVNAPKILSPASGDLATSRQVTVQLGGFTTFGQADTHAKSRFQIILEGGSFDTPAYDSGETGDLLRHTAATLFADGARITIRAANKGAVLGWGPWSTPVTVTVKARPDQPVMLTPADKATGVLRAPLVTLSAYTMVGGGTQDALRIQFSAGPQFTTPIYDSGIITDAAKFGGFKLPTDALPGAADLYGRAQVRDRDTGAWSLWSESVRITTRGGSGIADVHGLAVITGTNARQDVSLGMDLSNSGVPKVVIIRPLRGTDSGRNPADPYTLFFSSLMDQGKAAPLNREGVPPYLDVPPGTALIGYTEDGLTLGPSALGVNEQFIQNRIEVYKDAPRFCAIRRGPFRPTGNTEIDLSSLGIVGDVWLGYSTGSGIFVWNGYHRAGGNFLYCSPDANSAISSADANRAALSVDGTTLSIRQGFGGGEYILFARAHDPSPEGLVQAGSVIRTGATVEVNLGWRLRSLELRAIGAPNAANYGFGQGGYTQPRIVVDTVRGFGTGADRILFPSTVNGETTTADIGYVTDTGFVLTGDPVLQGVNYAFTALRGLV